MSIFSLARLVLTHNLPVQYFSCGEYMVPCIHIFSPVLIQCPAFLRYTLDINLPDEQVNHPLVRAAEGIVSGSILFARLSKRSLTTIELTPDHVGLVNDLFSYAKEKMTNSDDTNIIRILQDHEGLTYEQAIDVVKKKIRQKEQDFIPAGVAVLAHHELGKNPDMHRWIACMPYCMGGNLAWSQEVR